MEGRSIPAIQLVYEVVAKIKEGKKVEEVADLPDDLAYAAGVQIAADVRQAFAAATRRQLLAIHPGPGMDAKELLPSPPPIAFVHILKMHTITQAGNQNRGVASQLADMSSKLATKLSRWSAKRFSRNPELIDREGTPMSASSAAVPAAGQTGAVCG